MAGESGTGEELEALPIPASETIDRYESEYADLEHGRSSVSDQIQRAKEDVKKLSRQIEALQQSGPVPTDTDLERARKRREEGWALVRRAWLDGDRVADLEREFDPDHDLAEAYELSVIRADDAVDHIRGDADRVAQYENLLRQRDEVEKDVNAWERQRKEFDTRRAKLDKSWHREWHFLTHVPRPPKEMRPWVQAQARLVEQARQIRVAAHEITRTEELMQDRRSQLVDCLKRVEIPMPESTKKLEDLLDHCESAISTASEIRQRRQHLETAIADLKTNRYQAIQKRTDARTALEKWRSQWEPAVSVLGLTQEDTPSQANVMLDRLQDLFDKLEGGENLRIRIDGIRQDANQFQADVEAMVKQVAPELVGLAASQAASQLVTRLNQAREDKAASEKLRAQEKEKQGDLREAKATIKEMKSQLDDLCREASCAMDGLGEVEEQSVRKRNLQTDLQRLEQQLLSLGDGLTIDEIIQEADGVEQKELPTRLLEVENAIGELDRRRSRLDQAIGREETVLEDMDGNAMAAEAEEKAQSLLSEIQDCVDRFVRLRLASTFLHQQIERHREQNQDPVLRRAGETFARLTLGSFANLQTDFDDRDDPVLVGIRPSGEIVSVAGMSDGTLDQLYLSLRLASLEHTLEQNEPIPLIVDDVLINFDDSRAKAALEVLAEVSRKTQVICFTHHARLMALAEEALDDGVLHVHSLGTVLNQERRSVGEHHEAS
ncbi:MAG: hypothetical protein IH987_01615 [Planctomycetes bacterium]|nr:hypothetical protein [Planctomycetota bacterium]